MTDGVEMRLLQAPKAVLGREGTRLKLVAPMVGGIEASDGTWLEADEKIDGGPSVLSDVVVLLPSKEGATLLAKEPAARDFVADAFAHLKFMGYGEEATPPVRRGGGAREPRRRVCR